MAEENTLPSTWAELTGTDMFKGLPKVTRPTELTPDQSALILVLAARIDERADQLRRLGFFDGKLKDQVKASVAIAETVSYANSYFRDLAATPELWDEWTRGRDAYTLYLTLVTLTRFYQDQLGKSSVLNARTTTAG